MKLTNTSYVETDFIPLTVIKNMLGIFGTYSEIETEYDCFFSTNRSVVLINGEIYRVVKFYNKNKHILFKLKHT